MKNLCILIFLLISTLVRAQPTEGSYALSVTESVIIWKVDYSLGNKGHEGILKLISGTMTIKNGTIQNGNFVVDMNSVKATDMKDGDGKGLEEHLKNEDFLDVKTHPKGFFTVLSSVRKADGQFTVSGYLILKGISNTITFPVTIIESKTNLVAKSEFIVNRTSWGINYQSGILGVLKNEAISDEMNMTLNFVFKKAQ